MNPTIVSQFSANADGGWDFVCQHGPKECQGNMLHACVIKYSADDIDQTVNFVSCLMSNPKGGDEVCCVDSI